jgi:hypothetical protein
MEKKMIRKNKFNNNGLLAELTAGDEVQGVSGARTRSVH